MSSQDFKENDLVSADIFNNDLTLKSELVNSMKRNGKKGILLFVYAEWCGACMRFKPTFLDFMKKHSILEVKALPYHKDEIANKMNALIDSQSSPSFKIAWFPTIISFDQEGNFFSYYGNSDNGKYRTVEDLEEYCSQVGNYNVDFSILKI
jgi:thiol-disulfide isomerase/thioredoxin